jgi:hypothetical protein
MKAADSARAQLAQAAPRPDSGAAGGADTAKAAKAEPKGETMTTPDGREIQLPPGITAQQVREIFRKRFSGGTLTPQEQATMQTLMRSFRGGQGGMRRGGSDYQFGGNYIVFAKRGGQIIPVHVRTGLTDLDYAEVMSGLKEGDSVIMLPSASLVAAQQEFRQRIGSFASQGVPGMRQQQPASGQAATPARPQSGGPRQ